MTALVAVIHVVRVVKHALQVRLVTSQLCVHRVALSALPLMEAINPQRLLPLLPQVLMHRNLPLSAYVK
jgi:hypothetical protein